MKVSKPDYGHYKLSKSELVMALCKWLLLDGLVSFLFFRSVSVFLVGIFFFFFYLIVEKKQHNQKRLRRLTQQFKESLQILLSGLEAGYSVENAFVDACDELWQIYQVQNEIIVEFQIIKAGLAMNENLEQLLMDFAMRSGLEDVKSFAELVWIVKKRGGNLATLIRSSISVIQEKMEVYQEIETILSGKKMEQRIMSVMPVAVLIYVNVTAPGFFDVMYETLAGNLIMAVCLVLYLFAILVGKRIVNVEV